MKTKVKDVFKYTDSNNNEHLVCKGKLIVLVRPSSLKYFQTEPCIISEIEPVLKGDKFLVKRDNEHHVCLFKGYEKSSGYLGCYDDDFGWIYEGSIKDKIIVSPGDFTPEQLKSFHWNQWNNQTVFVKCDENHSCINPKITLFTNNSALNNSIITATQKNNDSSKPLPKEVVSKIINELKIQHRRKHGEKMKADKSGYEPKSKTYKTEYLYDDLEFILNHIHL